MSDLHSGEARSAASRASAVPHRAATPSNGDIRALIGWLAFSAACLFAMAVLP